MSRTDSPAGRAEAAEHEPEHRRWLGPLSKRLREGRAQLLPRTGTDVNAQYLAAGGSVELGTGKPQKVTSVGPDELKLLRRGAGWACCRCPCRCQLQIASLLPGIPRLTKVRFSPDKTMVFFTSNLFGASYVFGFIWS